MPHTIVIADDVTGANDIGIMYAKAGLDAYVYSYDENGTQDYRVCDTLIIDTDSRFDSYEDAYRKVYTAVKRTIHLGAEQYIDKQCSVFRGNIGAEFDAMLDALGEEFAVVVLGFPDNGRTTVHGIHYVHGIKLEESQFQNDPVHPMTKSSLRNILQSQTKRKVDNIFYETYAGGETAVSKALREKKKSCNYCIMDVRDNGDLELLAKVLKHEKILCGSSALSAYLAAQMDKKGKNEPQSTKSDGKIFCMAGSLTPQTAEQTEYMREKGYPVFALDTRKLFESDEKEEECRQLIERLEMAYESHTLCMLHSLQEREQVAQTKEIAHKKGMSDTEVSSLVSDTISRVACSVIEKMGITNLIVCGGDTSAAMCSRLGITGMKVEEEIEAGLPTCESVSEPHYKLVLKSGSFGSREFVEKAAGKLLER